MKEMKLTPAALGAIAAGDYANALVAATPGGIEAQEAAGQREVTANFDRLPEHGLNREQFEALGFQIGEPIDDVFVSVVPPAGWSLRPTEHGMHSDLLDDKGRRRGGMFYKAAFYDRNGSVSLISRFAISSDYSDYEEWENGKRRVTVIDRETEQNVFESEWMPNADFDGKREAMQKAEKFLITKYPDYANPLAYWS